MRIVFAPQKGRNDLVILRQNEKQVLMVVIKDGITQQHGLEILKTVAQEVIAGTLESDHELMTQRRDAILLALNESFDVASD